MMIKDTRERMGDKLRRIRINKGLTQMQLSKECGINHVTLRNMEIGRGYNIDMFLKILDYHDMSIDEFFNSL